MVVLASMILLCSQTKPQVQDEPMPKHPQPEIKKENNKIEIKPETPNRSLNRTSVWNYEGWGNNPEDYLKGEDMFSVESGDYYYKKVIGSASHRAIELNSPSYMQSTCKINAGKQNHNSILESMYNSVLVDRINEKKNENIKQLVELSSDIRVEPLLCRAIGKGATFTQCECVVYIQYKGGKEEAYKDIQRRLEVGVDE